MRSDPFPSLSVRAARRLTVLLVAAAVCARAAGDPQPALEPEAPATLLPLAIGDAGVDLSLAGSWSARASFGAGLLSVTGEPVRTLDDLPGITPGLAFSQAPDLSLSLTLLERWFIEVSVLGGFADSSLLMGYRRGEGPVRRVLLGTRDIEAGTTPFLETPGQAESSLGISALVASGIGTSEAMLRWDATGEQHRTYLGADELAEERIDLDAWIRGRFFALPDAEVEDLVVLLEDAGGTLTGGDGRSYRRAGFDDVILDAAAGRVTLRSARKGRVLAFYRKNGLPVGTDDASLGIDALPGETGGLRDLSAGPVRFFFDMPDYLGEDMNRRRIAVDGVGDCLLLWEPGDPSPFQVANAYAFSIAARGDAARITAFLAKKGTRSPVATDLLFAIDASQRRLAVLADRDFRSTFWNRYPFWEAPPQNAVNLLYGPDRDALAGLLDRELVVQALQRVDGYLLGSDVVPNSVRVTVNGLEERRFTVDASSGRLAFQVEIAPTDRIEVRWRTSGAGRAGGDVLLTWRNDLQLAERLGLWVAAGLRWNVGSGLTAGEPYARSGAALVAAGLDGSVGELAWSVDAAGSFANPDTTGVVRLHGMEGHSLEVDLSEERAYPAAAPDPSGPLPAAASAAPPSLANRGKLIYRDYRSYDALGGSVLHPIEWEAAVPVAYESGGRPGPYAVLGTSTSATSGQSLVLEYELQDAGDWVGAQLPVADGDVADLSTAKSIAVRMRGWNLAGGARVWLEAGAIGEDIDGDGRLDAEPSATSAGFAFDDADNAVVLKVGAGPRLQGNRARDSEDRDGSGTPTPEGPNRIVLAPAAVPVGDSWTTAVFELTDADRAKLQQARSVRIIVQSLEDDVRGKVLVDKICVAGTAYWVEAVSGHATVREVAERMSSYDAGSGNRLEDIAPDAMKLFHPAGEVQEVLEASWDTATSEFELTGYTSKETGGIAYGTAALYLRGAGGLPGSGATLVFELLDAEGKGMRWSLAASDLPDDGWHELRASADRTVSLDGTPVNASASFDADHGALGLLHVTVSGLSPAVGALYLDEVHLRDPRTAWGAALRAHASWSRSGALWQVGGMPVLSDASIVQTLSLSTAGFASLYGAPAAEGDVTSRTAITADILFARLRADAALRGSDGAFVASGGHRITIPAASSAVTFTDAFSLSGSDEFSREDALRLEPFAGLCLSLESRAAATAEALSQAWAASVDVGPFAAVRLGLDLEVAQSSTGYELPATWYGARWAREAALLVPWLEGATVERTERFTADLSAALWAVDAGLTIDASAAGSSYATLGRSQEDRFDVALSVAWPRADRSRNDGMKVALRYGKSLEMEGERQAGDPFAAEAGAFFATLARQRYLLGLPVVELFLDDTAAILEAWSAADRAVWNQSLSISFERRSGSRLSDLLVPVLATLTVSRELEKDADLAENAISIRPRIVTRALNLFGSLGSRPLVRFYRTDEFSAAVSCTVAGPASSALALSELAFEAYGEFLGFRDQSLTLVNVLALGERAETVTDDLQATFAWTTRPSAGVRLPSLPEATARTGYFEHRESLDLDLRFAPEPGHPLTLVLGHATSLVYPGRGSLKAGLKAGFDLETLSGTSAFRFALEASLEAKLTF